MKTLNQVVNTLIFICLATLSAFAQTKGAIYTFESDGNGFNTNTIFYDDGKEVVAFDAQFTPALAQMAIDFIRSKTKSPVKYLVITHPNPDKFNGIPAFKAIGAKVIMSKLSAANLEAVHNYKKYYFVEVAKMFTNETYPSLPSADFTFDESYTLAMANGGKVVLTEIKKRGISTNQTIAFITKQNALVVGDLVHHQAHAWLEGPIIQGAATYNGESWINVLKYIQSNFKADVKVYGGRGTNGAVSTVIPQQIIYLQTAQKLVSEYVNTLGGDVSKADYAQLQKSFEKAFPDYSLGYMIAYGAYGIVASIKK